ncbi:unnamed protein product [Rotaria sp. Silwood1]|nr:unnamed protein product [Rotaria sp. Silwood1]CAF3520753.1 unnamed protein product [Rotaria sp. Silwood1]CAF4900991.1 unnamed protein product [Rotaria sp. Silwood1]
MASSFEKTKDGKSSLINTLRGLKSKSPGAAKVDVVECTNTMTEYPDPKHPNLIYYNLPGVRMPSYPRDQYFEIIKKQTKDGVDIRDFDFFLIVSASRFTENDIWLAEQMQNTKFTDNEKWDFPLMIKSLICDHPDLKHNAIVISITVNCKDVIREKAKILRQQIWKVALVNGLIGAIPIPGVSTATGLATSTMMLKYYKECLGLDTESLDTLTKQYNTTSDKILEQLNNTLWMEFFPLSFTNFILAQSSGEIVKNGAKEAIKVIATCGIAGACINSASSAYQLHAMISNLEEAALFVLDNVARQSKQH